MRDGRSSFLQDGVQRNHFPSRRRSGRSSEIPLNADAFLPDCWCEGLFSLAIWLTLAAAVLPEAPTLHQSPDPSAFVGIIQR